VLLSFFGVSYVSAVNVFGLMFIVDSVIFKVRVACVVTSGVPLRLSVLFLVCSLLVCGTFLAVFWSYS
jgi:hypothetical protein